MAVASWMALNHLRSRRGIHRWIRPAFANRTLPTTPQPDENWWRPCAKWDPVWMAAASWLALNHLRSRRGIHRCILPAFANRTLPTTPQPDENWCSPCAKWDPVWMAAASSLALNHLRSRRGIHRWIRPAFANRTLPTTPQPDENWWSLCAKWDQVWMAAACWMAVNHL